MRRLYAHKEKRQTGNSVLRKRTSASPYVRLLASQKAKCFLGYLAAFLLLGRDNTAMRTYKRKPLIGDYSFRGLVHDHHGR